MSSNQIWLALSWIQMKKIPHEVIWPKFVGDTGKSGASGGKE